MGTKNAKTRTWSHELEVVGLGFRLKRETRRQLANQCQKKDIACRIEREPDNRADVNAIKVCLASPWFGVEHIGYFHRETAELLAPKLDEGKLEVVSAKLTEVHGDDNKLATLLIRFRDLK